MKPYFLAYSIIFIIIINGIYNNNRHNCYWYFYCHIPYHSCCLCCQGRFGVMLCLGPANIYFAIRVAQGFGYLAFKTVGAAESLHSMSENVKNWFHNNFYDKLLFPVLLMFVHVSGMYRYAGMFSCLLKFDLQLAVGFL